MGGTYIKQTDFPDHFVLPQPTNEYQEELNKTLTDIFSKFSDSFNNLGTYDRDVIFDSLLVDSSDTSHTAQITVDQVLAASNYGLYLHSDAVQVNAPLAYILQDNVSSDQDALEVENDGTGRCITIDVDGTGEGIGIISASTNYGVNLQQGGVLGSGKHGLYVYSNAIQVSANSSLMKITQDHDSSTSVVMEIENDGTGNGLLIDQNGNGRGIRVENAGTESGIYVNQGGITAAGNYGLEVRSNAVQVTTALAMFIQDNNSSSTPAIEIQQDGTGPGIKIVDGTESNGYVFTSDANGNGTWQDPGIDAAGMISRIEFDGTAGTPAAADHYNVTSITDHSAGTYSIVWDADYANANYSVAGTANGIDGATNGGILMVETTTGKAVGSVKIITSRDNGEAINFAAISVIAIGDPA